MAPSLLAIDQKRLLTSDGLAIIDPMSRIDTRSLPAALSCATPQRTAASVKVARSSSKSYPSRRTCPIAQEGSMGAGDVCPEHSSRRL